VFVGQRRQVALLRRLPDPLPMFRWIVRVMTRGSYLPENRTTECIVDEEQYLAFNVCR
jgi:hypothetical protein